MELADTDASSADFPYPVNITREDFADAQSFDPDAFLLRNHRYTSLDSLLSDLTALSKTLNQNLLDVVNDEYTDFIKLGQSIGDCLEYINNISIEIGKFKAVLDESTANYSDSTATTAAVLQHKKRMSLLKNKIKLILLLNEQCVSFETLMALDEADLSPDNLMVKLKSLATLHLSVFKIYSMVMETVAAPPSTSLSTSVEQFHPSSAQSAPNTSQAVNGSSVSTISNPAGDTEVCIFFEKLVKPKVLTLRHEFKSYLNELLILAKEDATRYSRLILMLLQLYRATGQQSEALNVLSRRK